MRVPAAFAVLIAAVLGGLLIYDATRADRIAQGVRAGRLDLGGMTRDAARRAVQARYGRAAAAPVVVTWHGRRFTLSPGASGAHVDAATTARWALARSRGGNPFGRAVRELAGGEVHADVGLAIRWSPQAVSRFVRDIAGRVDRRPRNADIDFQGGRLVRRPGRRGRGRRRARRRAADRAGRRSRARTTPIAARVPVTRRRDRTLPGLARRYPRVITINRAKKVLR